MLTEGKALLCRHTAGLANNPMKRCLLSEPFLGL